MSNNFIITKKSKLLTLKKPVKITAFIAFIKEKSNLPQGQLAFFSQNGESPYSPQPPASGFRAAFFAKPASMPVYRFKAAMSRLKPVAKKFRFPF